MGGAILFSEIRRRAGNSHLSMLHNTLDWQGIYSFCEAMDHNREKAFPFAHVRNFLGSMRGPVCRIADLYGNRDRCTEVDAQGIPR